MIVKYQVIKVRDAGQRTIMKSFSNVEDAIKYHLALKNGEFEFYDISVFYIDLPK